MWDIVGNGGTVGEGVECLWVYSKVGGGRWLVYASVMHSSRDPGGGWLVMAIEGVGDAQGILPLVVVDSDALGTSLVGVLVLYGIVSIAGMEGGSGGGSGGGRAVVQATEGGGTTAVGPGHRHSLLVASVVVV